MKFIDAAHDVWRLVGGEDGPPVKIVPRPHLLLTLAQWQAARAHWPAGTPVGVIVPNDVDIEDIADDLKSLALVVLQFPKWTDGRAYSQARLLRARWRFAGEIRATGDVVVDMAPLLARTGFDAAQLRADQKRESAERALRFFPAGHYQADVTEHQPRYARSA